MRLVRYADDLVLTFKQRAEAERMHAALAERLAMFNLQLHEAKTRLIEFGRFAEVNRRRRGESRPETFDFLGFTHYCGRTRAGRFMLQRKTQRQRMTCKLKALRVEMRRRMHEPVRGQQGWLSAVLRGHYAYYGITGNFRSLSRFYYHLTRAWRHVLSRRSQRGRLSWQAFQTLHRRFPLLTPRIMHVWAVSPLPVTTT